MAFVDIDSILPQKKYHSLKYIVFGKWLGQNNLKSVFEVETKWDWNTLHHFTHAKLHHPKERVCLPRILGRLPLPFQIGLRFYSVEILVFQHWVNNNENFFQVMCKPFLTTEIRWWRLHLTFHRLYPRANCKATGNYLPNDTLYAMTFHRGCAACILIKFSQNVFPFCED